MHKIYFSVAGGVDLTYLRKCYVYLYIQILLHSRYHISTIQGRDLVYGGLKHREVSIYYSGALLPKLEDDPHKRIIVNILLKYIKKNIKCKKNTSIFYIQRFRVGIWKFQDEKPYTTTIILLYNIPRHGNRTKYVLFIPEVFVIFFFIVKLAISTRVCICIYKSVVLSEKTHEAVVGVCLFSKWPPTYVQTI